MEAKGLWFLTLGKSQNFWVFCSWLYEVEILRVMSVKRTGKLLSVPVGDGMVGRVVNPLGDQLMEKGQLRLRRQDFLRLRLQVLWLENLSMSHFKLVLKRLMHLFQLVEDRESLSLGIDRQEKLL